MWCGRGAGLTLLGLMADPVRTCSRGARLWERALGVGGAWARLWVVVCGSALGVIFAFHQPRSPIFFFSGQKKREVAFFCLAACLIFVLLFVWEKQQVVPRAGCYDTRPSQFQPTTVTLPWCAAATSETSCRPTTR